MAALEEGGQLIAQPSEPLIETNSVTAVVGELLGVQPPYSEFPYEKRAADVLPVPSMRIQKGNRVVHAGRYVSNTDTVVERGGFELPGYALNKSLRVIALVDQTRVAVGAVIQ